MGWEEWASKAWLLTCSMNLGRSIIVPLYSWVRLFQMKIGVVFDRFHCLASKSGF